MWWCRQARRQPGSFRDRPSPGTRSHCSHSSQSVPFALPTTLYFRRILRTHTVTVTATALLPSAGLQNPPAVQSTRASSHARQHHLCSFPSDSLHTDVRYVAVDGLEPIRPASSPSLPPIAIAFCPSRSRECPLPSWPAALGRRAGRRGCRADSIQMRTTTCHLQGALKAICTTTPPMPPPCCPGPGIQAASCSHTTKTQTLIYLPT